MRVQIKSGCLFVNYFCEFCDWVRERSSITAVYFIWGGGLHLIPQGFFAFILKSYEKVVSPPQGFEVVIQKT